MNIQFKSDETVNGTYYGVKGEKTGDGAGIGEHQFILRKYSASGFLNFMYFNENDNSIYFQNNISGNETYGNTIFKNGNVGIGTTVPSSMLSLYQTGLSTPNYPSTTEMGDVYSTFRGSNNVLEFGVSRGFNSRKAWILTRHSSTEAYGKYYGTLHLQPDLGDKSVYKGVAIGFDADTDIDVGTHLAIDGKVGIGTLSPDELLTVDGNIHTTGFLRSTEVVVEASASQIPDYVFKPDYDLMSLEEVEAYVKANSHLPEVPSAEEVEANGHKLAEMNLLLLKKIEELTLHTIKQEKKISEQNGIISHQNRILQSFEDRLQKLESDKK